MKLGISSYTYTWALGINNYDYSPVMNLFDLIEKTRAFGLNCLQIADNTPLEQLDSKTLLELAKQTKSNDISIEVAAKGLTEARVKKYIEICNTFNCNLLRFIIDNPAESYQPSISMIINLCKLIEPALEKNNTVLVLENHDRLKTEEFKHIIESINSARIGICLDCANSLGAGEGIEETVNTLAPYTFNLHLKDIEIKRKKHMMGFDVLGVPFGKGIIPLEWITSKMPEKCRSAILELWVPPEKSIEETITKEAEWASESITYLKSLFSEK